MAKAARACDHSKGLAGVASEVRKLAERSQLAAAEISDLFSATMADAGQTNAALHDIVPTIQRTAKLVKEIITAMREQNLSTDKVHNMISTLDQITQANVRTATAANDQAQDLVQAKELEQTISTLDNRDRSWSETASRAQGNVGAVLAD